MSQAYIKSSGGGGGGTITTINTDSGTATPVAGLINLNGGVNINTSASGNTVLVSLDQNINFLPTALAFAAGTITVSNIPFMHNYGSGGLTTGNTFLGSAAGNAIAVPSGTGAFSTGIGFNALKGITTASFNTAVGAFSLSGAALDGDNNTAVGYITGGFISSGHDNTLIGYQAGEFITTGNANTLIGSQTGDAISTGSNNTIVGNNAAGFLRTGSNNAVFGWFDTATSFSGSESNNIIIGNQAVSGDANVIRIGTSGSGNRQQNNCFIAGILGVTPSGTPQMVTIGTGGELGSQSIPASGIESVPTDTGTSFPSSGVLNIFGDSNITTMSPSANTVQVTLNQTILVTGSMTAGTGFTAITGNVTIDAGNLQLPETNATIGAITVVGGHTLLHDYGQFGINDGNTFCGIDSGNFTLTGQNNSGFGNGALAVLAAGGDNTAVGTGALALLTSGNNNTALGAFAGARVNTGISNVLIGESAGQDITSGSDNIVIGVGSGTNLATGNGNILIDGSNLLTSGSFNIVINGGGSYTSSESSNLLIYSAGVVSENNTIRIGTTGSSDGQQNRAFLAGVYNTTPGSSTTQTVIIDNKGQLGSSVISGTNAWTEVTTTSASMVVNHGYITNNAGLVTVTLPSTAAQGSIIEVVGKGAGGWLIAQNAGQTIYQLSSASTTGATGSVASINSRATVRIVCITANNDFEIVSGSGTLTFV